MPAIRRAPARPAPTPVDWAAMQAESDRARAAQAKVEAEALAAMQAALPEDPLTNILRRVCELEAAVERILETRF